MEKYIIIDNFLEKNLFLKLKNIFFPKSINQEKLPWSYQNGIVRNPELGATNYKEYDWMYVHSFMNSQIKEESDFIYLIKPIFEKLNSAKIIDARANLLIPTKKQIYHENHVDRKIPHNVALFYVTTNNGFTLLNDNKKIECLENRILIFDGSIYHRSVSSTDRVRCVININYFPINKKNNLLFDYK
jgi:hypothetical protein